ncbi:SGNH/GDSL hydrolase family protein [Planctomicrobium sp. SH668]|uniref:SGNH/GDSL hydrolase family protein n=1 Tax=Planctomicrobium sp. SH668 TaxID=3448126 RepID=UPI003F5B9A8A
MRFPALLSIFCALFIVTSIEANDVPPFPGEKSDWNGYDRFDFEIAGKPVLVVAPKECAPGRPWVWHGEFFGHKPAPDIALLGKGFHIVYMSVPNMLGSPRAVGFWNQCYAELTSTYRLAPKVALVGLSRGGLYCYNWAAANPEKVACIYGDAPVCDFKSWPGGLGVGPGSPQDWKLVFEEYGFKMEDQALAYDKNPVDNLTPLAQAKVPLLHVYGDADEVVPWEENTGLLADRYKELGGEIQLIVKPGVKHHPHGLEDSTPIVEFIEKHASAPQAAPVFQPIKTELYTPRKGLGNFFAKLRAGGPVKVGFLGGSITAAEGWRVQLQSWLNTEWPNAQIVEINGAIGGTGSDLGVFRLQHDILRYEPDLLFVEFAVNDGGASPEQIWRAMEGIVRQTWKKSPETDLCFVYTFRTGYEDAYREGGAPRSTSAMEQLAEHYGIPSIDFAKRIVALQSDQKLVFAAPEAPTDGKIHFSTDGVHPLDAGHQIYADLVREAFELWEPKHEPFSHESSLQLPFIQDNWEQAKMVPVTTEMMTGDWVELPVDAELTRYFANRTGPLWEASEPGSRLEFQFRGSTCMLYDILAPDGGQLIITVDGITQPTPVPRFDSFCTYSRIATLPIAHGLQQDAVHTVTVEIHPEQPDRSPVAFRLKDPENELKQPKYQGTSVRVGQVLILGDLVTD